MTPSPKKYVTSLEAAGLLMVSPVTIREWARKGLLPSVSTAGGHRRFLLDQLQQFAQAHGIHLESVTSAPVAELLRVLLVDDDPVFAEYLREIVLASGSPVSVKCATDGFQAGQLTEGLPTPPGCARHQYAAHRWYRTMPTPAGEPGDGEQSTGHSVRIVVGRERIGSARCGCRRVD